MDGARTLGKEGCTKRAKKAAETMTGKKSNDWSSDEEALLWKIYTDPGRYKCASRIFRGKASVSWKIASKLFRDALTPEACKRKAASMKKSNDNEEEKNK